MTKVVGVRFSDTGKTYYFDPKGLDIKNGDEIIVETANGLEFGKASCGVKEVEELGDGDGQSAFKRVEAVFLPYPVDDVVKFGECEVGKRSACPTVHCTGNNTAGGGAGFGSFHQNPVVVGQVGGSRCGRYDVIAVVAIGI